MAEFETPSAAITPPVAKAPATETSKADRIAAVVQAWVSAHIHNSPISRQTDAMNHLTAALPDLVSRLDKEI